jgi:hypothetical protein
MQVSKKIPKNSPVIRAYWKHQKRVYRAKLRERQKLAATALQASAASNKHQPQSVQTLKEANVT